jgi:hypothetical protein
MHPSAAAVNYAEACGKPAYDHFGVKNKQFLPSNNMLIPPKLTN